MYQKQRRCVAFQKKEGTREAEWQQGSSPQEVGLLAVDSECCHPNVGARARADGPILLSLSGGGDRWASDGGERLPSDETDNACATEREIFSYIAGYVDGEACISLLGLQTLKLGIVSGDREVLELIAGTFGGSVTPEHRKYHGERHWYYRWRVNNDKAQTVLRQLSPFLVAKRDLARRACELEFAPRTKASPEVLAARRRFKQFLLERRKTRLPVGPRISAPV